MVSTRSRPPCAAGGIFVNSTDGPVSVCLVWQPAMARQNTRNGAAFRTPMIDWIFMHLSCRGLRRQRSLTELVANARLRQRTLLERSTEAEAIRRKYPVLWYWSGSSRAHGAA